MKIGAEGYVAASFCYSLALLLRSDARADASQVKETLLGNRSEAYLRMGLGELALRDAGDAVKIGNADKNKRRYERALDMVGKDLDRVGE
jgi:hypothetical protein